MKGERTDRLRRRPNEVRYFYLAVSKTTLHAGMSYGGLQYVNKNHGVDELYIADLVTGRVYGVSESVEDFMARWRLNYNNPSWDYAQDIKKGVPAPKL